MTKLPVVRRDVAFASALIRGRSRAGLAALVLAGVMATPLTSLFAQGNTSLCAPPSKPYDKVRMYKRGEISFPVPSGWSTGYSSGDVTVYESGTRWMAVLLGNDPTMLSGGAAQINFIQRCDALIGDHTVEVVEMSAFNMGTFGNAETSPGRQYIYAARWPSPNGAQDFTLWVVGNDRKQLESLRGLFWGVTFPAKVATAAKPDSAATTATAPRADSASKP